MTERPVIVVVVKGYPRLSETFVAQEILSLEKAGFSLHIVSLRRPTDKQVHPAHREISAPVTYLPEYLHEAPLRVIGSLAKLAFKGRFYKAMGVFLRDLRHDFSRGRLRRFGQGAVLAANLPDGAAFLYAHFIHSPASVTHYASLMSALAWGCSAHAKDIWTSPDRDLGIKLKDAVFTATCTKAGLSRLNALAPPGKPARLVYHGLDASRLSRMIVPANERDGRMADKPVRLLSVARAVEKKGLDTLIEALSLLPKDLFWTWTHIGGGTLAASLAAQAEALGIGGRCRFLGALAQTDVMTAYRESDIFVLACRIASDGDRDGLPNVLMEAGSMGLALVSTPVSGIGELIEDGITGALVEPDLPEALSEKLRFLASNPDARYRLGRAAAWRIQRDFVHEDNVRALIDLFPVNPVPADRAPADRKIAERERAG